jgi:hypothetical protein
MTLRTNYLPPDQLKQFANGDLLRVVGRGPIESFGRAHLLLEPVTTTGDRTEAESKFGHAWNAYVFARASMAPGAGMAIVSEPDAWEALSEAMSALTTEWNER